MRKILTLVGMFLLNTCTISNIIACSSQVLDGTLKIISGGETNYEGWNLNGIGIVKPGGVPNKDTVPKLTQEITKDKLPVLVQTLAQMIITKAGISNPILWFNEKLNEGAKCYDFTINNGTSDKSGNKTWNVNGTSGRIAVDITYQMGVVLKDKTFQSQQQINVTFNLKCDYTWSDYMVYTTVKSIDDILNNTLKVTIVNKDWAPKVGTTFSDLNTNLKGLIQIKLVEQTKGKNPFVNSVATTQKGITDEVVSNLLTIKITFNVEFQDSFIDMAKISPYSGVSYPPTIIEFIIS